MRRYHRSPRGTVHRLAHDSKVLIGNALDDPTRRELHVYTPPGWAREELPLLVNLPGYWGSGPGQTAWKAVGENVPERLDRLISSGEMPPCVVAFPDCFTRLRGNQYINSVGTGRYADYLLEEVVPFVEDGFVCGGGGRRGLFGKSSGGYGAAWHGMHHADFWAAISVNSADMGFEVHHLPEFYLALDVLRDFGHSIERFVRHFESEEKPSAAERSCLMFCAMSAFYDPAPEAFMSMRLPGDPHTAELYPERWANWLRHDPVVMMDERADELRKLKGIWLDCGNRDQFRMHFGMRRFHKKLEERGVPHVYEEYDDDHTGVDYRMERFLPFLAEALSD
ncbi:MAG: enterochelin esterase and related enzyme [uncultured Rubrobacteraceae bacterium]|uniref:Enterochelin esterase and related enzyme n=1 Tax=uncultured Rubrobacteraceae bacterium TaxID=349277 RepID=A0A6J4T7M2_9ACTN|nr:MAG: enterochelin esterase and related enzyme [uncultured Rubrobacteraceae bacterium]